LRKDRVLWVLLQLVSRHIVVGVPECLQAAVKDLLQVILVVEQELHQEREPVILVYYPANMGVVLGLPQAMALAGAMREVALFN